VLAHRPDPDDASAQIDLIGVPWMIVSQEPSAVPNGGSRVPASDASGCALEGRHGYLYLQRPAAWQLARCWAGGFPA